MKAYRLVTPRIIKGLFIGDQVFEGPVEFLNLPQVNLSEVTGLLAHVDGQLVEVNMSEPVQLVVFLEPDGDERAVNPHEVMQVQEVSATTSRIHMAGTANFVVQGSVTEVVEALGDQ